MNDDLFAFSTRMHSSKMLTTNSLPYGGVSVWGSPRLPRQRPPEQRPPDRDSQTETSLDNDLTPWTMTSLPGQRPTPWTETPPPGQIPPTSGQRRPSGQRPHLDRDPPRQRSPSHVTCGACWDRDTHLWTESQTGVKTLPCPRLRLRAVTSCVPIIALTKLHACYVWWPFCTYNITILQTKIICVSKIKPPNQ